MSDFKKEVDYGIDNFQQQKVLTSNESLVQVILNLFFMKPGNLPNLPYIGININSYLYKLEDQLDADELKKKIFDQCSELISYINIGEIKIFISEYKNQSILLIYLPVLGSSALLLGFTKTTSGEVLFNYDYENNILSV
jgi:hypothetical protein